MASVKEQAPCVLWTGRNSPVPGRHVYQILPLLTSFIFFKLKRREGSINEKVFSSAAPVTKTLKARKTDALSDGD